MNATAEVFEVADDVYPGLVRDLNAAGVTWTEHERPWGFWVIVTGTSEQVADVASRVGLVTR